MSIEKYADLGLKDEHKIEEVEAILQEKMGIKLDDLRQAIGNYVQSHSEEMSQQFNNIAPLGDYSNLLEDRDSMSFFLKDEAFKNEHWKLFQIEPHTVHKNLLHFTFKNSAIDDGNTCRGFAFVSLSSKLRHAFARGDDTI
jgi:hypothetical protein